MIEYFSEHGAYNLGNGKNVTFPVDFKLLDSNMSLFFDGTIKDFDLNFTIEFIDDRAFHPKILTIEFNGGDSYSNVRNA